MRCDTALVKSDPSVLTQILPLVGVALGILGTLVSGRNVDSRAARREDHQRKARLYAEAIRLVEALVEHRAESSEANRDLDDVQARLGDVHARQAKLKHVLDSETTSRVELERSRIDLERSLVDINRLSVHVSRLNKALEEAGQRTMVDQDAVRKLLPELRLFAAQSVAAALAKAVRALDAADGDAFRIACEQLVRECRKELGIRE